MRKEALFPIKEALFQKLSRWSCYWNRSALAERTGFHSSVKVNKSFITQNVLEWFSTNYFKRLYL